VPRVPVPSELSEFLSRPNPAVIATLRADGSLHTAPTWYDWIDGRVLVNMDESRVRLEHLRRDPRAALTILGGEDWYRHVSLIGQVVSIEPDAELADIDRLAVRYTGKPFRGREAKRASAWLEPERWHAWSGGGAWEPS
jgi:PPOX class probable F420-dependent enzyme